MAKLTPENASLIEGICEPALVVDTKGIMLCSNLALQELVGYSSEELIGQPFEMLIHPEFRAAQRALRQLFWQYSQERQRVTSKLQNHLFTRQETMIPVEVFVGVTTLAKAKVSVAYFRQSGNESREGEGGRLGRLWQRLMLAQHVAGYGAWDLEVASDHFFGDPLAQVILGRSNHIITRGTELFSLIEQGIQGNEAQELALMLQGSREGKLELTLNDREDGPRVVQLRWLGDAVPGEKSRVITGVVCDVTSEREKREQLAQAKESAEAATRAKSAFLANMSHELRTPMNAILGFAELLRATHLGAKQQAYVDRIVTSGRLLVEIINDILDFSKIEANRLELEQIPFELDTVLHYVANVVGLKAAERDLEVVFRVADDVPNTVVGDALRLSQVIANLVSNAVKFSEHGDVEVEVSMASDSPLMTDPDDPSLERFGMRVSVGDHGIGMSDLQVQALFAPFVQADISTTRKFGGSGLGLAIAKRLVEMMGGSIEVTSRQGQGSTFSCNVMLSRASSPVASRADALTTERLQGHLVLLVIPSPALRQAVEATARALGLQPVAVGDPDAAWSWLRTLRGGAPRLLVLDSGHSMSACMDFAATMAALSQARLDTILLAQVFAQSEVHATAVARGIKVRAVLPKPLLPAAMRGAFLEVLGDQMPQPQLSNAQIRRGQRADLRGLRGLIVEDNEVARELMHEMLVSVGMEVTLVCNGEQALAALTNDCAYDVILMDCQMPVMDGFETALRIEGHPKWSEIPVVAMTASAMQSERERMQAVGMKACLLKPVDVEQVYRVILDQTRQNRNPGRQTSNGIDESNTGSWMEQLVGIDWQAGLELSMNREPLYHRLLQTFAARAREIPQEMARLLKNGDTSGLARTAHTLRGMASTVGAIQVAQAASALEHAAADPAITASWRESLTEELVRELSYVQSGLAALESTESTEAVANRTRQAG